VTTRKSGNYDDDRAARRHLSEFVGRYANQLEAARKLGISQAFLSAMLNATSRVPDRVLRKIGYRREVKIVRIGASILA
jgi:ribosome-binding protein aMBF1 (putative translation factor)